jgi:hypothetical protein
MYLLLHPPHSGSSTYYSYCGVHHHHRHREQGSGSEEKRILVEGQ